MLYRSREEKEQVVEAIQASPPVDEDDDMLTSMAKELVQENGIDETADSVWRQPAKGQHTVADLNLG